VSRRRAPRRASSALRGVLGEASPRTLLAEVQSVWREVCGEAVAAEAQPVAERDGVVTVACRSSTWASELDLMQGQLLERLNDRLGEHRLEALRFTADAARFK
jgi:predicted nucleic acid-binding Zn ribbon protein